MNKNEIEVWLLVDDNCPTKEDAQTMCSWGELAAASRLICPDHGNLYLRRRAALRSVLGRYLNTHPADIRLKTNINGKPYLDDIHQSSIQFNLSHVTPYLAIAISNKNAIGIDIESYKAININDVLNFKLLFSNDEKSYLTGCQNEELNALFFKIWTMKEALSKAIGDGLVYPLHKHTLLNLSDLQIVSDINQKKTWYIKHQSFDNSVSLSIASEDEIDKIQYYFPNKSDKEVGVTT